MAKDKIEIELPEKVLKDWQEITNILAQLCRVPAALIMKLQDPVIEVCISSENIENPYHPGDKEQLWGSGLYCETVLKKLEKLHVPHAASDDKWKENPDMALKMVSYLGFPIMLPNKKPFGTICILDTKENEYSKTIECLMIKFRDMIESHLEIVYANQLLGDKNKSLTDYLMEIQAFRGMVSICSNCKAIKHSEDEWRPIERYLAKHPEADFTHSICPVCTKKLYPELAKHPTRNLTPHPGTRKQ